MNEQATYFWTKEINGKTRVGLTKAGQDELGSIKFAHLPKVGDSVKAGATLISVEAEKAVSDIDSPVSGKVAAVNPQLDNDFDALNSASVDDAWLVDIQTA